MDADQYKKTIEDAIAGEIEAKEFYLEISKRIRDDFLKDLFLGFSKEEAGHEKILTALLKKGKIKTTTFDGSQDFKVSTSVSPLMRAKIQKPLLFIQSPTSEPLPMAIAR